MQLSIALLTSFRELKLVFETNIVEQSMRSAMSNCPCLCLPRSGALWLRLCLALVLWSSNTNGGIYGSMPINIVRINWLTTMLRASVVDTIIVAKNFLNLPSVLNNGMVFFQILVLLVHGKQGG
jgi:hypothetical protein